MVGLLATLLIAALVVIFIQGGKLRQEKKLNGLLAERNMELALNYNMFAQKPVMTLLSDEQFTSLARVVTSTVIAIQKQPN